MLQTWKLIKCMNVLFSQIIGISHRHCKQRLTKVETKVIVSPVHLSASTTYFFLRSSQWSTVSLFPSRVALILFQSVIDLSLFFLICCFFAVLIVGLSGSHADWIWPLFPYVLSWQWLWLKHLSCGLPWSPSCSSLSLQNWSRQLKWRSRRRRGRMITIWRKQMTERLQWKLPSTSASTNTGDASTIGEKKSLNCQNLQNAFSYRGK